MGKPSVNLGPTPAGEECAGAGASADKQRKECTALKNQLIRICGQPPEGARFFIKTNHHEYGTYYELECEFTEGDEASLAYALKCESEYPEKWDTEARVELGLDAKLIPEEVFKMMLDYDALQAVQMGTTLEAYIGWLSTLTPEIIQDCQKKAVEEVAHMMDAIDQKHCADCGGDVMLGYCPVCNPNVLAQVEDEPAMLVRPECAVCGGSLSPEGYCYHCDRPI